MLTECTKCGQPLLDQYAEYCPECRTANPNARVGAFSFLPWWAWLFVVACIAAPFVTLSGVLPSVAGLGAAAACAVFSKNPNWSTIVRLGICSGITLSTWLTFVVFGQWFHRDGAVGREAALAQLADEVNRALPKMVDDDTELTNTFVEGHVFAYNYRLVKHAAEEVNTPVLVTALRPQITKANCSAAQPRSMLEQGTTIRYRYSDKDWNHIVSIDVTLKDCGG